MSKSTGPYPRMSVDATGTGVVSHAGAALLLRTAEKSGLTSGADSHNRTPVPRLKAQSEAAQGGARDSRKIEVNRKLR